MKMFILLSAFFATQAFANGNVHLECIPKQPCLYASRGLNHCLTQVALNGKVGSFGIETLSFRPVNPATEVMQAPQTYTIMIGASANKLSFRDRDGEQWGTLVAGNSGIIYGTVTVDEDFQFQVMCRNKAIGFE
ncbi:MAG: hypothetical protein ACJ763_04040 [Bdellovibrionia bacterium]